MDSVEVSAREAEVLALLGLRLSNAQMAGRLHVSVRTVEGHVSSLLRKYGVADRKALAELAATVSDGSPPSVGRLSGLPRARTSFVGRAAEHAAIEAALDKESLVTLLGPGGAGKTRLAAAVAEAAGPAFPFGGAFVDLVPVGAATIGQSVAAALGVTEKPRQPLADAIAERLGRGRSLLVLDNCEHLLDAVAEFVETTLVACPAATILATSRERLGVAGERVVSVGPLPLSTDPDALSSGRSAGVSDAERLFRDRALAVAPDFAAAPQVVTDLCARLDGLPLAIELAAARCASLGAAGLLTGLGDYLRLLAGGRGAAVRHRSLRAVIDWSHELLDGEEQTLFRRLSVFAGGFTLDAAVAVSAVGDRAVVADVLGRLVDKNLVVHRQGERSTWRLLETIRAFAADRLEAEGEHTEVRRRHLGWALVTATALESRLGSIGTSVEDFEHSGWRDDFDLVAADLRTAHSACPAPAVPAHRLARSFGRLTYARRFLTEAREWFERAAAQAPTPGEAASDLSSAADCALVSTFSGYPAFDLLLASADQARAAADRDAEAIALARAVEMATRFPAGFPGDIPHERLGALLDRALEAGDPDDPLVGAHLSRAAAWNANAHKLTPDPILAEKAVAAARVTGDPVLLSASLDALTGAEARAGRWRAANRLSGERIALLSAMNRHDPAAAVEIVDTLGAAYVDAVEAGDLPTAAAVTALIDADDLTRTHSYVSASRLVQVLVLTGDFRGALAQAGPMWAGWERAGRPAAWWLLPAVAGVALVHGLRAEPHEYRKWRSRLAEVAAVHDGTDGSRYASITAFVEARTAIHHHLPGQGGEVEEQVGRAFAELPRGRYLAYARAAGAELAVVAGLPSAQERLEEAATAARENDWAAACLARAHGRLHADLDALREPVTCWERVGARFERACTLLLLPGRPNRRPYRARGAPVTPAARTHAHHGGGLHRAGEPPGAGPAAIRGRASRIPSDLVRPTQPCWNSSIAERLPLRAPRREGSTLSKPGVAPVGRDDQACLQQPALIALAVGDADDAPIPIAQQRVDQAA